MYLQIIDYILHSIGQYKTNVEVNSFCIKGISLYKTATSTLQFWKDMAVFTGLKKWTFIDTGPLMLKMGYEKKLKKKNRMPSKKKIEIHKPFPPFVLVVRHRL